MKIHFINVRTMHHSSHSGYDRIMDHFTHTPPPTSGMWKNMLETDKKKAYEEAKSNISWYNSPDLEMEINTNALNPWLHRHICHFLYGENSIYHIKKSQNLRKKVFVTFHQPPDAHLQFVRTRKPLQNIDGIIVVGTNQIPFFSQYVNPSKIFFVPHGIDTDFFKPNNSVPKDPNKVLFVGNWLRDFDTLIEISKILAKKAPNISIDVVTLEKNKSLFEGCNNISFHSGIPEEELLLKYQSASLLLIPMKDCTANNSVLEGMACGLPIITTDIGGIKDYVDKGCAVLCKPQDVISMADTVLKLISSEDWLREMSERSRMKSLEFAWKVVSKTLASAYKAAFGTKI